MCAILGPKQPICTKQNFLVQTIVITFIYLLALFIVQNFKKFLQQIQNYHHAPFLSPKWSICPKQFFFWKLLLSFSAPFIGQNLKKFFQRIQSYEDVQFMVPKWPISPNKNFFRKPVNEPCFFYSCLSTCQKSKSDTNLLVKYWWLKNTVISFAESHCCR